MAAKAIMIQGTASNAGKSIVTAALCRIFKQDGYRVAPFKSQNMALNSYITADGLEMGRAQVMQAEAAGVAPDVRMNPILLKPTSDVGSQVILNGKAIGNRTAKEYWSDKKSLRPFIKDAYESLAADYDIVVIEGAGSPAEINLKQDDLVNMGMAEIAHAPVLLVGDIDRGGVFASLYGTVKLLEPSEQDRIQGLIINKFRGDLEILKPGLVDLERLTGKPVIGVVPYTHLDIDDEDSLSERLTAHDKTEAALQIAVIRLPHLSNFTDFSALERMQAVSVRYVDTVKQLENADFIILPGTKSTMDDLKWLRTSGLEAKIQRLHHDGIPVFGICGGYQMMGCSLQDPEGVEGGGCMESMHLLPTETIFRSEKTTTQTTGQILSLGGIFQGLSHVQTVGYEIHMGDTHLLDGALPFQRLMRGQCEVLDGCWSGNAYGTYMHGVLDTPAVLEPLIHALLDRKGMSASDITLVDPAQYKEEQYNKLADMVRSALDMDRIYQILEANYA